MRHLANQKFWAAYDRLSDQAKALADKNFELLKTDPTHPGLQLKKVGRYWSARVGRNYRAVAVEYDGHLLWFWIGTHAEYDRLLR